MSNFTLDCVELLKCKPRRGSWTVGRNWKKLWKESGEIMEIVAEYFFVNSKYENMKSERVEGLTYWEKQQRRLEEYFSLFDVLLLWIIGILGPNENFFRVNNTKLLDTTKVVVLRRTSSSSDVNETQYPNLNLINIHAIYNFNQTTRSSFSKR